MAVSFYGRGGETTGSVSDRTQELRQKSISPKCETTGSCGYLREQAPRIETLDKDTVCFKGNMDKQEKSSSFFGTLFTFGALAAISLGTLAAAHKYKWADKLLEKVSNPKIKNIIKSTGKVTEPCYNWCKSAKTFCTEYYDKIAKKFKK